MAHDIRSFGRRLLIAVDVLAALTAAVFVVVLYAVPDMVGSQTEGVSGVLLEVRGNTAFDLAFFVALLLLLVHALYFFYGRTPSRPLQYVVSEAPGGFVKVSREAIESGLRATGEGLDVVSRLRVSVEHGGLKRILVRAHFQAPEGCSIPDASTNLRSALASRFAEMVQATEGMKTDFDIEFVGFSGKLSKKAEPSAEPDEEPEPFTGPQYPIPDEDQEKGAGRG